MMKAWQKMVIGAAGCLILGTMSSFSTMTVITSYSIHYTKLYENVIQLCTLEAASEPVVIGIAMQH